MSSLTQDRLKEVLGYDPETGSWTWLECRRHGFVGKLAGSEKPTKRGTCYRYIRVEGVLYLAHRLAFLYMTGKWPPNEVDHRNGETTDNRWKNLRFATRSQNAANCRAHKDSVSGVRGVSWDKVNSKWLAQICVNGRNMSLGRYETQKEAAKAYSMAERVYKGTFRRIG